MTYRISKTFSFAAAHCLDQLPADHKCHRLHGHNYTVQVILSSDALDQDGFVEDYGALADVAAYIDDVLDHQNLSEVFDWPVTAEHLARFLFGVFAKNHPALTEVVVCETPRTTASYRA